MDVGFGFQRNIKIDDMRYTVDVDSPCRNIRRHENFDILVSKRIQRALAGILRFVSVDRSRLDSGFIEPFGNNVGRPFGFRKHDGGFNVVLAKDPLK